MKPGRHEPKGGRGKGVFTIGSHVNDLDEFDFYNQFLGGSLFREVTAKTLKHAALLVKKSVLQELRESFPAAFNGSKVSGDTAPSVIRPRGKNKPRKYKDFMSDAVRVGKLKGGWNHQELKVHILGSRAKGSGTYRLRFYEGGGPRTKRGSIPGYHFFHRGQKHINIWEVVKANINKYLKENGWL